MPNLNIREYDSNAQIQASDRGPESMNIAGRRIGALYSEAASAQQAAGRAIGSGIAEAGENVAKYMGVREISHGAVGFSGVLAAATQDWNDTAKSADANDPTVAQKFVQEKLEPALEKFQSGFTTEAGRKWAEERVNALRNHFTEKTIADMSTKAGIAAHVNVEQTGNTLESMVAKDPSTLNIALDTLNKSIEGISQSPNLTADNAAKVQGELTQHYSERIVKAAIQSQLYSDPAKGEALAKDPRYAKFTSGAEINAMSKQIQSMRRTDMLQQKQLAHEEQQKNNEASMDTFLKDRYGDKPSITTKDIADLDPRQMDATHKRIAINIIEHELKPEAEAKVYQRNAADLFSQIVAPTGDGTRITDKTPLYKALAEGKIGQSQFNFLEGQFDKVRDPQNQRLTDRIREVVNSVKEKILKPYPGSNIFPVSGPELYAFQYDLMEAVQKARVAGNIDELLNPHSPNYFASNERVASYQTPMSSRVKQGMDAMRGKPPAKLSPGADAARKLMFGDGPVKPEIPGGK